MTKKKPPALAADLAYELERLKSDRAAIKDDMAMIVAGCDRLQAWATKLEAQIHDLRRTAYVDTPQGDFSSPQANHGRTIVGGTADPRGSVPPKPGKAVDPRRAPDEVGMI